MKIFGIDIVKGSVRSRTKRPRFALVIRVDGEETWSGEVSVYRLLRRVDAEQPDILAVDSIQEIASDSKGLYAFLQMLPSATSLVQVTGGERPAPLARIAARFNIRFENKFDPYCEAGAAAQIAELGGGAEVIAFEDRCAITVSRRRSIGKGGWSQNRYTRKIHGAVQRKGREIEEILKEEGLCYKKSEVKAFGGLGRVRFDVSAPRDLVPVRSYRGSDVQVRITAKKLDRIRFRPLRATPRYLIVGIDPGTTTGIAALDLDGNPVLVQSSRQMSIPDVREVLFRAGKPLIVASDVTPMPSSVEKIRRAFSAVAYVPREDRSVEDKKALCGDIAYGNDHERDALSAASDAYRQYRNKFSNLQKRVPPGHDMDEVRAGVVRGLSLEQVIGALAPSSPKEREEGEASPAIAAPPSLSSEELLMLEGQVKRLRAYSEELKEALAASEAEISRLKEKAERERSAAVKERRRDVEISRLSGAVTTLKKQLKKEEKKVARAKRQNERLRRFADLQSGDDNLPLKVLSALTRDGLRMLEDDLGCGEGDIIYAEKTGGWGTSIADALASVRIKALIVSEDDERLKDALHERTIPLLTAAMTGAEVRGRTGRVSRRAFEKALGCWEKEHSCWEKERKSEMIESIFSEYRSEREREVRRDG